MHNKKGVFSISKECLARVVNTRLLLKLVRDSLSNYLRRDLCLSVDGLEVIWAEDKGRYYKLNPLSPFFGSWN